LAVDIIPKRATLRTTKINTLSILLLRVNKNETNNKLEIKIENNSNLFEILILLKYFIRIIKNEK
jgi:hypothetical protein